LSDPTNDKKAKELIAEIREKNIPLSDLTSTTTPHGQFLHSQPLAAKVGNWLFCHAGLYPQMSWTDFQNKADNLLTNGAYADPFLIGSTSVLEAKDWWRDSGTRAQLEALIGGNGFYGIVFGHQPDAFGWEGQIAAIDGGKLIKIDNGMAPEAGSHPGSLLLFGQPSLMNTNSYPNPSVILANGDTNPLVPGALNKVLPPPQPDNED